MYYRCLALFTVFAASQDPQQCVSRSLLQKDTRLKLEASTEGGDTHAATEHTISKIQITRRAKKQAAKAKRVGSRGKVGRHNASSVERAAAKHKQYEELIKTFEASATNYYPYDLMSCASDVVLTTTEMCEDTYDEIVEDVQDLIDSIDGSCNSSYCPQAELSGCFLRMAGHDFMDYKNGTGGSDGCVDFSDTDNSGLSYCLYVGLYGASLQDAYSKWCGSVSLADFIVIAAEAAMSWSRDLVIAEDSTAVDIDFASRFVYGRTTSTTCSFSHGRLPNPERGCTANEETFIDNMGLTWEYTTALMGVHSLGKATQTNSGYDGWWSDTNNSRKFNNNYYVSMLLKGWIPEKNISGNSAKNQWQRGDLGAVTGDAHEMMLDTDLCLAYVCDPDTTTCDSSSSSQYDFKAADLDCCAWVFFEGGGWVDTMRNNSGVDFCGYENYNDDVMPQLEQAMCCEGQYLEKSSIDNCQNPAFTKYVEDDNTASYVKQFAGSADKWLSSFLEAWVLATGNGFSDLSSLDTTYVLGDAAGECDDDNVITDEATCLAAVEALLGITSVTTKSSKNLPYGCSKKTGTAYFNSKTTGTNSNAATYPVCFSSASC